MLTHIGVDVAKRTLEVAALSGDGEAERARFGNCEKSHQALVIRLSRFELCHVVGATGSYHQRLVKHLQRCRGRVSVVNPAQAQNEARSQRRRNKTDGVDALLSAQYGSPNKHRLRSGCRGR